MRIKNVRFPKAHQNHLVVQLSKGVKKWKAGEEADLDPASAVGIMARWPGCFEVIPDPVPERTRAVPRKAIPTANKQIRTAPKDK
jgi:hypothetical protein